MGYSKYCVDKKGTNVQRFGNLRNRGTGRGAFVKVYRHYFSSSQTQHTHTQLQANKNSICRYILCTTTTMTNYRSWRFSIFKVGKTITNELSWSWKREKFRPRIITVQLISPTSNNMLQFFLQQRKSECNVVQRKPPLINFASRLRGEQQQTSHSNKHQLILKHHVATGWTKNYRVEFREADENT